MENKKIHIKCKLCTSAVVCYDCTLQLCENGQCDKCPICRQENWKKIKTSKTKICIKEIATHAHNTRAPTDTTDTTDTTGTTGNQCYKTTRDVVLCITNRNTIYYAITFLGYSFLFGIITLMFTTSGKDISLQAWEILVYSLVIGMVEVVILLNCCRAICCDNDVI